MLSPSEQQFKCFSDESIAPRDDAYASLRPHHYRNFDDMPTEGWSATEGLVLGENTMNHEIITDPENWLTTKEASAYLGVHSRTLARYIVKGLLHPRRRVRHIGAYLFNREELDAVNSTVYAD
jgi:excisionase family DNA binding protein